MAGTKQIGTGLLFRLIVGIFIPILLAFALMACILFLNINIGKFQFPSIKGIWLNSLNELGGASLKESTSSVNALGEAIIRQQTIDVAKQLEIYLKSSHKNTPPDKLFATNDPILMEIVTQKVGKTGYIVIYDTTNVMRYHPVAKFINVETVKMYDRLGPDFVRINETALAGQDNGGYYQWPDENNKLKPKYLYVTRVKGTNLFVAATTWIDEFSQPAKAITAKMEQLQKKYSEEYNKRFGLLLVILVVVMIILFVVIYLFASFSIVRPIRHLSDVADKISMGDMNATVDIKEKGEIGVLAQSIERMQTSVKAAIERLQKRR